MVADAATLTACGPRVGGESQRHAYEVTEAYTATPPVEGPLPAR